MGCVSKGTHTWYIYIFVYYAYVCVCVCVYERLGLGWILFGFVPGLALVPRVYHSALPSTDARLALVGCEVKIAPFSTESSPISSTNSPLLTLTYILYMQGRT